MLRSAVLQVMVSLLDGFLSALMFFSFGLWPFCWWGTDLSIGICALWLHSDVSPPPFSLYQKSFTGQPGLRWCVFVTKDLIFLVIDKTTCYCHRSCIVPVTPDEKWSKGFNNVWAVCLHFQLRCIQWLYIYITFTCTWCIQTSSSKYWQTGQAAVAVSTQSCSHAYARARMSNRSKQTQTRIFSKPEYTLSVMKREQNKWGEQNGGDITRVRVTILGSDLS